MTQLAADQQLTLQAFQAAVDTYNQRQMALPEAIAPILPHLDQHLADLDSLSETDPTFEMLYQTARSALQNGSDRAKFLDTSTLPPNGTQHGTLEIPSGNDAPSPNPSQPIIYRHTLPNNATPAQIADFQTQVEAIRQANPDWVVVSDRPHPGESDAIIIIHKDEQYAQVHGAYITHRTLNDIVAPSLIRIFKPRS